MPAFLEIGNEPNTRLWSADPVDHLVSTGQITRWILTLGTGEWSLLGYNDVSNATKLCLQGCFPTHWDQRSMAEQFKWLSNTIGDHVPSLIFRKPLAQDASPILMIAAEACCAIPLSVCRDQLPKDSLNLLFGVSEQSSEPLLFSTNRKWSLRHDLMLRSSVQLVPFSKPIRSSHWRRPYCLGF